MLATRLVLIYACCVKFQANSLKYGRGNRGPCPKNFELFSHTCITKIRGKFTYADAIQKCSDMNAKLFAPESNSDLEQLVRTISRLGYTWIGVNDIAQEGKYVYEDYNCEVKSTRWKKNQPDNHGNDEHCIEINNNGYMNDNNCDRKNKVICQTMINNQGPCESFKPCPKAYVNVSGICYQRLQGSFTVVKGIEKCFYRKGHLPVFKDKKEFELLFKKMKFFRAWSGIIGFKEPKVWAHPVYTFKANRGVVSLACKNRYVRWQKGHPRSYKPGYNCAELMDTLKWYNTVCGLRRTIFCQRRSDGYPCKAASRD